MSNEAKEKKSYPVTPVGRVSFHSVFEATGMEGNKPTYHLTLIFPANTDLSELKKYAGKVAVEEWGAEKVKAMKLESPFRDAGEKSHLDGYDDGMTFVSFKSWKRPPAVVGPDKQPITEKSGNFYNGCYARVSYDAFAYDHKGKKGVSFTLVNVQKARDGERFGGGHSDPDDDFDTIEDDNALSDFLGDTGADEVAF